MKTKVAFALALALFLIGIAGSHAEAARFRRANLSISAVSAPSSASPGTSIVVSSTIKNQGAATSNAFRVAYYLTTSPSSTTGAPLLGTQDVAGLAARASLALVSSLAIPGTTTSGTFYVVEVANSAKATSESNASNNTGASGAIAVEDLTSPKISAVASSGITASNATIVWTTNKQSTSQVEYGTTTAYGSMGSLDTSKVTSHDVTLSGLATTTVYHFRVHSQDAAGNAASSSDFTFTTPAPTAGFAYYVATNGSDANPGTDALPFRTIQKAADVVSPGDTVIVKDGTYVDTQIDSYGSVVRVNRGGDATRWVTFKSENPWGAKIDGQNNTTEVGWWVEASYVRIEGFDISNLSKTGLEGWSSHIQIVGNNIHHIGRICTNTTIGLDGVYLDVGENDWVFENNTFHDIGRLDSSEGCGLTAHLFNDHGLYLAGVDSITIKNNIFYDILRGWSIHLYNGGSSTGSSNVKILHNTFAFPSLYNSGGHIILASPSVTNSLIANNIFYQPSGNIAIAYYSTSLSNVEVQNNITYQGMITASPPAGISFSGSLDNTDPQFISPSTKNFHLLSTSPAIDAGVTTAPPVTTDFNGTARPQGTATDLGAMEFTNQ